MDSLRAVGVCQRDAKAAPPQKLFVQPSCKLIYEYSGGNGGV